MEIAGDYARSGYALIRNLIPPEVAAAFVAALREDIGDAPIPLSGQENYPNLLRRAAFEIYGFHYKPMLFFLWGLTASMSALTGRDLLPSYDYFRVYREGDVCRVHHDRLSCEHSLSLTLDYSDGVPWSLEIGGGRGEPSAKVDEDFGSEKFVSLDMNVGDAVLYRGVEHRHGRVTPNPNAWSAHLFLHWVDRHGPHADQAFDGRGNPSPTSFSFA
jgi:hypothetical protein